MKISHNQKEAVQLCDLLADVIQARVEHGIARHESGRDDFWADESECSDTMGALEEFLRGDSTRETVTSFIVVDKSGRITEMSRSRGSISQFSNADPDSTIVEMTGELPGGWGA